MGKKYSLSMMEPPLCPPDGYYRWLNHEQEFSEENSAEEKVESVKIGTSAIINSVGLFFGIGCLFYALIFSRKK